MKKYYLFFFVLLCININSLIRTAEEFMQEGFMQQESQFSEFELRNESSNPLFFVMGIKKNNESNNSLFVTESEENNVKTYFDSIKAYNSCASYFVPKHAAIKICLWQERLETEEKEGLEKIMFANFEAISNNESHFLIEPLLILRIPFEFKKDTYLRFTSKGHLKSQKKPDYSDDENITNQDLAAYVQISSQEKNKKKETGPLRRQLTRLRSLGSFSHMRQQSVSEVISNKFFEIVNKDKKPILVFVRNGDKSLIKCVVPGGVLSKNNAEFNSEQSTEFFIWDNDKNVSDISNMQHSLHNIAVQTINRPLDEIKKLLNNEYNEDNCSSYFISLPVNQLQCFVWENGILRTAKDKLRKNNRQKNVSNRYIIENFLKHTEKGWIKAESLIVLENIKDSGLALLS
ncbi:MAG: hypothetical protein WCD44_02050 [Candidatus Babeliales bacterium]